MFFTWYLFQLWNPWPWRKFRAIKCSPVAMLLCWKQSASRLGVRVRCLLFINIICFWIQLLGLFKLIAYWWIKMKCGLNWVQNKAGSKVTKAGPHRFVQLIHFRLEAKGIRYKVKGLVCFPSPFPLALFSFPYLIINSLNQILVKNNTVCASLKSHQHWLHYVEPAESTV